MRRSIVVVFSAILALFALGPPVLALTGKVIDSKGKAVSKAKVRISLQTNASTTKTVYTDKKGEFRFEAADNGWVVFNAVAGGYTYARGYYRAKEHEDVTLKLWPEKMHRGKVVDENGKPIAGASVSLEDFDGYSGSEDSVSFRSGAGDNNETVTKQDGSFVLRHLPDPNDFRYVSVTYSVTAKGRALLRHYLNTANLSTPATVRLPKECKLTGTVYLPDNAGKAPKGAQLSVQLANQAGGYETRMTNTSADGTYMLDKLPPGKVNIFLVRRQVYGRTKTTEEALGDAVLPLVKDIELVSNQMKTVDISLIHGVMLACKFVDKTSKEPFKRAFGYVQHAGMPEIQPEYISQSQENNNNVVASAYVVPGEVTVSVQDVGDNVYFSRDDAPHVTVKISPDEKTREVTLEVDPSESRQSDNNQPVPEDVELMAGTYTLEWNPDILCQYSRGRQVDNCEKLKKLPDLKSKNPKFFGFQLDGSDDSNYLYVAIDESNGTGKGYDTVYIDANRNLDLTDDTPLQLTTKSLSSDYRQGSSEWVAIQAHQGQVGHDPTNNPIQVQLTATMYSNNFYPELKRKGAWYGELATNKGNVKCLVVDQNRNGLFNDQDEPDYVYADLSNSGRVTAYPYGNQALRQMNVSVIAGKPYEIRVNEIGNQIIVNAYTGSMGKLIVTSTNVANTKLDVRSLGLQGDKGTYSLSDYDGSPIDLPAGKYQLGHASLQVPSKKSDGMTISCAMDGLDVDVRPNEQAVIDLSGKITSEVRTLESTLKPGQSNTIEWPVKIGDKVTVSQIQSSNYNETPQVTFYNKAGKEVLKAKAGYT